MFDPNHNNSGCNFGEQIVSYLYDEIGGADKHRFENHLDNCQNCAAEISDFTDVRLEVAEMKREFSSMKTPLIQIPYVQNTETVEVVGNKSGWFDGIRVYLSNLSSWQTASAGFAVLILMAIFSVFLLKSDNNEIVSELNRNVMKPNVSPTIKEQQTVNPNPVKSPETEKVEEVKPLVKQPEVAISDSKPNKEKTVIKISERSQPTPKNDTVNKQTAPKNNNVKTIIRTKNDDLPKLNNDDEIEDNSLRLTDIFEEIGSVED